jgi:5-methylcytosine-specific restriction protein A
MPAKPPKPCTKPGCRAYATTDSRCDDHQRPAFEGRGSGSSRGYGFKWSKIRDKILDRDQHLCQECDRNGRVTRAAQVDHIRPKYKGGTDNHDNLEAICEECHKLKTSRESAEARTRR